MTSKERSALPRFVPLRRPAEGGRLGVVAKSAACAVLLAVPVLPASAVGLENLTPFAIFPGPDKAPVYRATGTVEAVYPHEKTIVVRHGAIASLRWAARTTKFGVKEGLALTSVLPHDEIAFEFSAEEPDRYVIRNLNVIVRPGDRTR